VRRRRRGGTEGGVSRGGGGSGASGVEAWVSCVAEGCEGSAVHVDCGLVFVSSRRMLMMGTSSAGFMYLSSREGGRPWAVMRVALARRRERSLACERRYIVSSPAGTVSQMAAILRSRSGFREACWESRGVHCGEEAHRASKWSSRERKWAFCF